MAKAYIGIGSNLGNRHANCTEAVELLRKNTIDVTRQSAMHETKPWGVVKQPAFINMAVEIETDLTPLRLLSILKKIETAMGREDTFRWGPRIIDLDILLYDDLLVNEPGLVIPHPFMHERDFVLKPLSEIAPEKVHPLLKKTILQLMENRGKN